MSSPKYLKVNADLFYRAMDALKAYIESVEDTIEDLVKHDPGNPGLNPVIEHKDFMLKIESGFALCVTTAVRDDNPQPSFEETIPTKTTFH